MYPFRLKLVNLVMNGIRPNWPVKKNDQREEEIIRLFALAIKTVRF
jgi:hypothetical protein